MAETDSLGENINDEILQKIRAMNHEMTKQIRENVSPEVILEVKRKMRELERQMDNINDPIMEQVKADIEKLNRKPMMS